MGLRMAATGTEAIGKAAVAYYLDGKTIEEAKSKFQKENEQAKQKCGKIRIQEEIRCETKGDNGDSYNCYNFYDNFKSYAD